MTKLILLFVTLLTGITFLMFPNSPTAESYFPFSDMQLYLKTHVYYIFEKLIMIVLAYIIASESKEYKQAVWVFFGLMVCDLIDYLLTYSSIWFNLGPIPVSMNTTKVFIFGLTIFYEWLTSIGTRYFG